MGAMRCTLEGMKLDEVKAAALALPVAERAELAHALLRSLDEGPDREEAEDLWWANIERRAREVADGTVEPVDWETVRRQVESQLRDRRR